MRIAFSASRPDMRSLSPENRKEFVNSRIFQNDVKSRYRQAAPAHTFPLLSSNMTENSTAGTSTTFGTLFLLGTYTYRYRSIPTPECVLFYLYEREEGLKAASEVAGTKGLRRVMRHTCSLRL